MTVQLHEHHWVSGPRAHSAGSHTFEHAHELPSKYHRHPCTGPGHSYTWKEVKKPRGEQLRFIPPEPGEDTFKVVISSAWTADHERSMGGGYVRVEGTDPRAEHDETVANARLAQAAQSAGRSIASAGLIQTGLTVNRISDGFGMTALYEVDPSGAWCCGKPREAHADWDPRTNSWHCPEADAADAARRARLAERTAAELAEMGWAS